MEIPQGPFAGLPPVLWFTGAAFVLLWVVTRPRLARQALHLVMSHPAYLVPAAMAVVVFGAVTLLSEPDVSAGREACFRGGGWIDASPSPGAALTLTVSGESAAAVDCPRPTGGVFTEGSGVEVLERGVAFSFEPLLPFA
jgi:hypothetical protein